MIQTAQDFHQLAHARKSIRQFEDRAVPLELVRRVLATACRAPSAHNRQPWRFVVLTDRAVRAQLVEAMSAQFRADLEADGLPPETVDSLVERGRRRLLDPPLAILLCLTTEDMDVYPDDKRRTAERMMAVQSTALAGGHLLLAAQAEGLGACWVCAPLFVPDLVRRELDLPPAWEAQGVLIMGYPAEPVRDRSRRPVDEVTIWR